jgi:L-lactate dehydrogenase complex protein LldG
MSARELVLNSIRRALGGSGQAGARRATVEKRIARHARGIVPERAAKAAKRLDLFRQFLTEASGTSEVVVSAADVPAAVTAYLRSKNLPMRLRRGSDPRLEAIPWDREPTLDVSVGASRGKDLATISHAFAAVAETGTLVLVSGQDNPTTLNFLPEQHLVVVNAKDIVGSYEAVWDGLREKYAANLPRTVNWITGPSRSADIEQVILHGAHGPKGLHVLVIADS